MRKKLLWIAFLTLFIFSFLGVDTIKVTAQEIHDLAVISVKPSQTSVRLGELVNITVDVENQGTSNETFNVTTYYDNMTYVIETKTGVSLANGTSTSLTFTWNTTEIEEEIYAEDKKEKAYIINATASTVSGETDTADNKLGSNSKVTIRAHYIAVIPQSTVDTTLTPGKNYTVSIYTDYNGSDVWGWQFTLSFNPHVLEGIEVVNGDLITEAKDSSAEFTSGTFNNTAGTLDLTWAYFEWVPPATPFVTSGPGILANVTFLVKSTGESSIILSIETTELRNPEAGVDGIIIDYLTPFLHHIMYGYFRNTEAQIIHDIAVTSVTLSSTIVEQGELVNITVGVENQGTETETFDVTVYYNYSPEYPGVNVVEKKIGLILAANASVSLDFIWDTTNVVAKNYTITAVVSPVYGEIDTENNSLPGDDIVTLKALEAPPIPIELIIGIVVVIVAISVAWYAVSRTRKKPIPE